MNVPPPSTSPLRESAVQDERFWAKTKAEGDCIVYTGHRDRQGYGKVFRKAVNPTPMLAHRYAYYLHNGPFGAGIVIRHSCDNPPCVKREHLLAGTQADNIADRDARGHHRPGRLHGEQHSQAKLADSEVMWIRRAYWIHGWSQTNIARDMGVHVSTIQRIVSGRNWTHLPMDGIEDPAA